MAKTSASRSELRSLRGKKEGPKKLTIKGLQAAYGNKIASREVLWGRDGLYAEVLPSGKITFRYRYRLQTGKREKVTLGSFPALSMREANRIHTEMRARVARGLSPADEKRLQGKASSSVFLNLAIEWVDRILKPVNKNSRQDETYLKRDIIPFLGHKDVNVIDRKAIWSCIEVVQRRGHLQAARRVQSVLKRVFEYGSSKGVVKLNPMTGIDPRHVAPAKSRDRVLAPEEIPRWLHAVETSSLSRSMKLALRLLLLIPVRKGELLSAKWKDVDLSGGTWDIPKENSKNSAPIRHRLGDQALQIFHELKQLSLSSEWVLPSSRNYGAIPISKSGINTALRGVKGLPEGVVIHDLRRTVRTYLTELGVAPNVAELCLNHRPVGIKKVYDRAELIDHRYAALQRWEQYLHSLLSPPSKSSTFASENELDALLEKLRADEDIRDYVIRQLLSPSQVKS